MNKYVVILSIGPVQSMIASARRSRDLWSGSWLLSELAKAGAKALYEIQGAELIFPHVEKADDLQANSDFSVGNKLQIVIETNNTTEVEVIIQKVKTAVLNHFKEEAQNASNRLKNQSDIRKNIWHLQIEDFVEIQSAWAKIVGDDYKTAVELTSKILASRKATREFNPLATSPYQEELMIPKSSLDGLRETVLKEDEYNNREKVSNKTRNQLSLAKSEQLDAVGVIKRLGFDKKAEQFTPISRVMADAWIKKLIAEQMDLTAIKDTCEQLVQLGIITRVTGNKGIYKDFAYDAQILYKSRLEAEIQRITKMSQNKDKDDDEKLKLKKSLDLLKKMQTELLPKIWSKYGEPYTYGALLLADGDRMGELLDKAKNEEQHKAITKALSNFAGNVADIMRKHQGHCIYAGGDDVLGFVPLDTAYECANALRNSFANCLQKATDKLKEENKGDEGIDDLKNPTLSVGIAICHLMTPLGIIRELAGQAEKYAKGDHISKSDEKPKVNERRNALGIVLSVRGGNDTKLRFNWSDDIGLDTFKLFTNYYINKNIPSRIAYDIRAIYLRTQKFAQDKTQKHINDYEQQIDENGVSKDLRLNIQIAELTRMLKQARTASGQSLEQNTIDGLCGRAKKVGLNQLADELIVARWLAAKTQKDLGKE